jgi:histidyl-tRNA synthetase
MKKKFPKKIPHRVKQQTLQLLRGMKDILPEEQKYWFFILEKAKELASAYGFEEIETPILEKTSLFERAVGEESDIIEKEMYTFQDQGGDKISLRPEVTASVARAYIEHGMINLPQPVKLYSFGPMFRYNRPQASRYRQFHQFNLEVLGTKNPIIDAQIILLSKLLFQELGLKINIQINSIGCQNCRKDYKKKLVSFYRYKKSLLCKDCQRRLIKNPLRVLDCKEETCQKISYEAPQVIDFLCEGCKNHFTRVLEYLSELEIPFDLNPRLVRGLDYYEKTVFEILPPEALMEEEEFPESLEETSTQRSLGGGGRYDQLVEMLGGRETPSCGVAFGIERIISEMRKREVMVPKQRGPEVFLAQLGEEAKKKALLLFEDLRKKRIKVAENFSKDSLKSQIETADKLGAKICLILGQKEILDGTVLIRNMEGGVQETVRFDEVVAEVKKRLKKDKFIY